MKITYKQKTSSKLYSRLTQVLDKVISQDYDFIKLINNKAFLDGVSFEASSLRQKYNSLAIVGMGGSILGAKMMISSYYECTDREVIFFDDFDVDTFYQKLEKTNSDTHWLFISKSGETVEVLTMLKLIDEYLLDKGIKLSDHSTVITVKETNLLNKWASDCGVKVIDISPNIPGRFSVLSVVGMLPCAFSGIQISKIHEEANNGLSSRKVIVNLSSQIVQSFDNSEWITAFWIYSDRLLNFGYWLNQLWSESFAKAVTRGGIAAPRVSTPMVLCGVKAQHSILQQVVEGSRDKFIWLIRSKVACDLKGWKHLDSISFAHYEATCKILEENKISCLKLDEVDSMGKLVSIMQTVVVVLGEFLDIDVFVQPGVERAKQLVRDKVFQSALKSKE